MVYPASLLNPTGVSLLKFIFLNENCLFFLNKIKRGVLRRGTSVAWPNGIVPYEFLPGYGMDSFMKLNFETNEKIFFKAVGENYRHYKNFI
jgi:hypothetical protein